MGTAIGMDGSRFYGSWQAGKLHGKGVRTPHHARRLLLTALCSLSRAAGLSSAHLA